MHTILHDVRYAARLLRRSPGFAVTAILTLALAIGANTAIFSAVQGVLIAPLPYPDPDRLVRLFEETPTTLHFPMAPADFRDYRDELQTFDGLAAYFRSDLQIGSGNSVEQLRGMQVTAGFFSLLGVPPVLGREFDRDDEIPANNGVVILSHALWMRRFDGDANIVGRPVRLSGRTFQVVGVLPERFQHVGGTYRTYGHGEPVDVWTVLPVPREERPGNRYSHFYNVVGRVKRGVTPAAMADDLRKTGESVARRYPSPNSPWKAKAVPLKQEIVGSVESTIVALAAAAGVVLLLACVNIAGLLLGRAASRSREIGVRTALGATGWRITQQLLIESILIAAVGGAIGVAVAYAGIRALSGLGASDLPRLQMIAVDRLVLFAAVAATAISALLFGLVPALRLARVHTAETLREGGRSIAGSSHQRARRLLASVQVALAFVLVVSSGLLLRSFVLMINTNPGFLPAGAMTAIVELPVARYQLDDAAGFYERAADRVRALPGVADAAFSSDLPWTGYDENTGFDIPGRKFPGDEGPEARYHFLTPGYIRATGTPLVAGREIATSDVKTSPLVLLINESLARKYWASPDAAVGTRVNLWGAERTIVGVMGDVRDVPWHERAAPALYFPVSQMWYAQPMFLIVRTSVEPSSIVEPVRRALRELDPEVPLANVRALASVASAATETRRLTLWLVLTFGLMALVLALVGIYGVVAQAVGQRTHEFGVRQALGATRGDILRLVFSGASVMIGAGLAAGAALALFSTRLLTSLLYGVTALDAATFGWVAVILTAAAAGASYLPARRATRISAASALRASD